MTLDTTRGLRSGALIMRCDWPHGHSSSFAIGSIDAARQASEEPGDGANLIRDMLSITFRDKSSKLYNEAFTISMISLFTTFRILREAQSMQIARRLHSSQ